MVPGLYIHPRVEEPRQHDLVIEQVENVQQRPLPAVPDVRVNPCVQQAEHSCGVAVLDQAEELLPLLAERFREPASAGRPRLRCGEAAGDRAAEGTHGALAPLFLRGVRDPEAAAP
jgi:hypothetical protein